MELIHLRARSEHSIGASVLKPNEIARRAKQLGMPAVGLADVDTLCGAFRFWREAIALGVQPIPGIEIPFTDGNVMLYARNREGWDGLVWLATRAIGRSRDAGLIDGHGDSLVAVDCPADGIVARALEKGGLDAAIAAAVSLKRALEPGCFFLGVGPDGLRGPSGGDYAMKEISRAVDVPLALAAPIGSPDGFFTAEQALAAFPGFGDAIANTARIAELSGEPFTICAPLDSFPWPRTYPELRDLAEDTARRLYAQTIGDGLAARLARLRDAGANPDEDAYRKRLDDEIGIVRERGLEPIFMNAARIAAVCGARGIAMRPGHDAMTSSLLLFVLGVTEVDPIAGDLPMERFLDPERLRLPEIAFAVPPGRVRELLAQTAEAFPEGWAMPATRAVRNPGTGRVERHVASTNCLVVCNSGILHRVPVLPDRDAPRYARADVLGNDAMSFGLWTVEVVASVADLSGQ